MKKVEGIETTHPTPILEPKSLLELEFERFMARNERALHPPPLPKQKIVIELASERFNIPMECIDVSNIDIALGCFHIKTLTERKGCSKIWRPKGNLPI
ncbi:unnamed protein product [Linum trigynum]|uniref:Uncharacterized protein n=1 Tax=Linum trigynum TaxID=586398 RepID=A0AAV2E572_9ROSI